MRRLGEGLSTASAPRPPGNDEEIGVDEEDGGTLARAEPDRAALAKRVAEKFAAWSNGCKASWS